ncbi:lipopolysaccharide transport system permease protein [Breznakia sp. PF5-3]|uniref:ABC transporter permease n=1 Tax=unclassified Breznakia TaxID=2623764 RepID=UPI002404C5E3|nr:MULTISPECIES: ABC transporter permease [unclassified Breznakia]MDF9824981.1 lipopolysaccharide transport system permease protein [Breznakia sp. PM6-1]MDF9835826.1 lipopolysaccharide transport system permease protein [Breznakia sp. PF5-3]MDF9836922.1 lipopolysaccharide transport system permease protein [Breznakia sp. PFB2-8]MDF9859868.1 lipopolysaccharide transport system permease protein [Breznakia sp. PH5-24]
MKLFNDLYNYRELLKSNVKKEIRGKYKGSLLGVLWSFISPLLQVLVYVLVFPYIMRTTVDNYLLFLVVGIIPWTFFITSVNQGMAVIRSNAGIIKKVYFPREILPISVVISGLVNFFISCIIIVVFVIFGGSWISWHIILLPFLALIQSILILGMIFLLSAINVYIKDTEYIVQFILNMLFYGTPILYDVSQFSKSTISVLFKINPLTTIINSYRDIFLNHQLPDFGMLAYVIIVSLIILFVGYAVFKKLEKGFAEEV